MDATSRRAFALDSRTVWVEQQLVHGTLMARDNLPLGPGEYTPSSSGQVRHVATPVFGKPRDQADFFPSFSSPTSRRTRAASPNNTPLTSLNPVVRAPPEEAAKLKRLQSPTQAQIRHLQENSVSADERSEFKTIFHDKEKRDPFDTNRRYCVTPGSYLKHDSILETVKNDGKYTVRGAIPFGPSTVSFGSRGEVKHALPTYDVNYDSKYVRPVTKLGSFPKVKRIEIPLEGHDPDADGTKTSPSHMKNQNVSPTSLTQWQPSIAPSQLSPAQLGMKSITEMRCSLVRLPKVKQRRFSKIDFDDSSYQRGKKQTVLNMTPMLMRHEVKERVFEKLMAIPRPHKAPGLNISLHTDDY